MPLGSPQGCRSIGMADGSEYEIVGRQRGGAAQHDLQFGPTIALRVHVDHDIASDGIAIDAQLTRRSGTLPPEPRGPDKAEGLITRDEGVRVDGGYVDKVQAMFEPVDQVALKQANPYGAVPRTIDGATPGVASATARGRELGRPAGSGSAS